MKNVDERLNNFSNAVLKKAFDVREAMTEELENNRDKELKEREMLYLEEAYKKIQINKAKIIQESNEDISRAQIESKKELIKRRNEIIDEVFEGVLSKLKEFMQSLNYYSWLCERAEYAMGKVGNSHNILNALINKSDEHLQERLKNDLDIEVDISKEDIIGGIIVCNREENLLLDLSLKENLYEEKNEFLKNAGLNIDFTN